jgi:hypothetical protein
MNSNEKSFNYKVLNIIKHYIFWYKVPAAKNLMGVSMGSLAHLANAMI